MGKQQLPVALQEVSISVHNRTCAEKEALRLYPDPEKPYGVPEAMWKLGMQAQFMQAREQRSVYVAGACRELWDYDFSCAPENEMVLISVLNKKNEAFVTLGVRVTDYWFEVLTKAQILDLLVAWQPLPLPAASPAIISSPVPA